MVKEIDSKKLANLDPDRIPLPNKATGFKSERNMKITGVAMIAIGATGAITSAASIVAGIMGMSVGFLPAGVLIGVGIGSLAASISSVATGVFLLKKGYWEDQTFVDKKSLDALNMSFDDVVKSFGWKHITSQHLISNKALRKKFFEKIDLLDYNTVVRSHGHEIREHGFIGWNELKSKLIQEASTINAESFKQRYGDQPLRDGVVDAKDDFYTTMMKNGIKDLPYHKIVTDFAEERSKKVLTNDFIAEVLKEQMKNKTFFSFFNAQGRQATWMILKDGILPLSFFTEHVSNEIKGERLSVRQILQRYGWEVFELKILQANEFREQLLQEVKGHLLSQIIANYGWKVLDLQMATNEDLHPHAVAECHTLPTFERVIEKFGSEVFERRILTSNDEVIKEHVRALHRRMPFCEMIDRYARVLIGHQLLTQNSEIQSLLRDKDLSDQKLAKKNSEADQSYTQSESQAAQARDAAIQNSQQTLDAAKKAIETERTNHRNNQNQIEAQRRDEMTKHTQTVEALRRENQAINVTAEESRHQGHLVSLNRALEQENTRHRYQIRYLEDEEANSARRCANTRDEQQRIYERIVREAERAREERKIMARELSLNERVALNARFKALNI